MPGGTDRAETPRVNTTDGQIDRRQHATNGCGRCFPRATAGHCIGIKISPALLGKHTHRPHVRRIVRELQLFDCRVAAFYVFDAVKELGILTQGARNRAQPANVLGVSPTSIVATAIAV